MDGLGFLFEFVLTVAALTVPETADAHWPRGVQEDEPKPWTVHVLDRRGARTRPVGPERQGRRHPLPSLR